MYGAIVACTLVAALADPDRGCDAIVIGEYERAFYGSRYMSMAPLFAHYGIALWTPEAGGPVGTGEDHEQLMLALGLQAKRRLPAPGSVSAPLWRPRPASRAVTWAAARRMDAG